MSNEVAEDNRAIVDWLKGMTNEEIRATLEPDRHNFSILIDNRTENLNAGSIVRLSNWFLAKNVFFYGRRSYNRKPSICAYVYENIQVAHDLSELEIFLEKYKISRLVGIDNNTKRKPQYLHNYEWNKDEHTLICLGAEGSGLAEEIIHRCHDLVEIQGFGSARSINVATAASVVFYDYCLKCGLFE